MSCELWAVSCETISISDISSGNARWRSLERGEESIAWVSRLGNNIYTCLSPVSPLSNLDFSINHQPNWRHFCNLITIRPQQMCGGGKKSRFIVEQTRSFSGVGTLRSWASSWSCIFYCSIFFLLSAPITLQLMVETARLEELHKAEARVI